MSSPDALGDHLRETLGFQYDIGRLLGRGGMGAVYAARERALDRDVAIKVLPPEHAGSAGTRERFLREARTAARLTHPNIVPLHTFGDTGVALYFVMGLVEGESLEERLRRDGRLHADDAGRMIEELLGALEYAHGRGIIHRDIKPDNILIERTTGRAMLTDFGIAKQVSSTAERLTQTAMIVGTPRYMSPEQAAGEDTVDGRSDLYSLGLVAYTMLSGRPAFDGASARELIVQQVSQTPVALRTVASETPMVLASAVERCLHKEPAQRWPDASRMLEALRGEGADDDSTALRDAKRGGWIVEFAAMALIVFDFERWAYFRDPVVAGASAWMYAIVPMAAATNCWLLRRKGASWREVRVLAFGPSTWWPFWWPASLRRPSDVWSRLPKVVRVNRLLRTLSAALFVVALQSLFLLMSAPLTRATLGSYGITLACSFVSAIVLLVLSATSQFIWGRKHGLSAVELDRVASTPTSNPSFWKRPAIARLLSDAPPAGNSPVLPASPSDLVRAIRDLAAELPAPFSALGAESVAAARQLHEALDELDREIAQLAHEADPVERARIEQKMREQQGAASTASDEMGQLYAAQLALLCRIDSRLQELTSRRRRIPELLRVLWLQLTALRGDLATHADSPDVTGQIRSVIADAERYAAGLREVQTPPVTTLIPLP